MNAQQILDVVTKGFTLLEALRRTTEAAAPAIKATFELIEKYQSGAGVTQADLDRVEQILDEQLSMFNEPLPED